MSRISEELSTIRREQEDAQARMPMGVEKAAKELGLETAELRALLHRRGVRIGVPELIPGAVVEALRLELAADARQESSKTRSTSQAPPRPMTFNELRAAGIIRPAGDEALERANAATAVAPEDREVSALVAELASYSNLRSQPG